MWRSFFPSSLSFNSVSVSPLVVEDDVDEVADEDEAGKERGTMTAPSFAGGLRVGREARDWRVVARRRWLQKRQWWVWMGSFAFLPPL